MYLTIVFLPLFSFLLSLGFGKYLTSKGSSFISNFCIFVSFLLSLLAFYEIGFCRSFVYIKLSPWIDSELIDASWGFLFDTLSITMCVLVTCISLFVHLYSTSYMSHDPHKSRFMSYLSLFTFFMLMLINSDNFLQLFFGWEGVGLCSYLLINFWFTRLQANKSAIKAMIINRIGDVALTLGILSTFVMFKTFDFSVIFSLLPYVKDYIFFFLNVKINVITIISIFLFIGAIGKSAQLGFHTWLPDAMEGPTPVSALIHAATMVTAGVFMIIRCSPIYEYALNTLSFIAFIGVLTSFFAGTISVFQNDLKKIIAYSTCSQLGYMIFVCGLSSYSVSLFHVLNHAYFKALLFLSAGSIIHSLFDEQDIRRMGGFQRILPITYLMICIGSLALIGFPFLTGFYSKDVILEIAYSKYNFIGTFSYWLGIFSASITAFYSFKLIYLTFLSNPNGFRYAIQLAYEPSFTMILPLILLCFCSIFLGFATKDLFIGIGTPFWNNALYVSPSNSSILDAEFIPLYIKCIPFFISVFGGLTSIIVYYLVPSFFLKLYIRIKVFNLIYVFFNKKWFFDRIQNELIASFLLRIGFYATYKTIDKGFLEFFGPDNLSRYIVFIASKISKIQSGRINLYAFLIFSFLTFFSSLDIMFYFFDIFIDFQIYFIYLLSVFIRDLKFNIRS